MTVMNKHLMDNSVDHPPAPKRRHLDDSIDDVDAFKTTESMFAAPDNESALHILNSLNDHCLQEIFKRVSIVDLSSASEVCQRFKRNAEEIFSLYHEKRFRFVSLTLVKAQVFHSFVHLIKSVYLNGSQASRCLKYFTGSSLMQSLHLRGADIDVEQLKPLLPKLTSLEISSCEFVGDASDLFSFCHALQYLKVKLSKFDQFLPFNVPKLEKFEYDDYQYTESLRSFIETNRQLSSISITTVNKLRTPIDFIEHLLQFANFKSLHSLKLPCFQFSVTPLLRSLRSNNIPMQQLELIDCRMDDESFHDIFQMKSIRILSITGIEALSHDQFVGLAKELPELQVLRIETPYRHDPRITIDDIKSFAQQSKNLYLLTIGTINHMTIDQGWYNHLLDSMVKDRRKTLTITIIYENLMNILVPKQTLMKHKQRIRIVKIKYDNYNDTGSNASESNDDDDDSSDDNDGSDSDEDSEASDESSDFASIIGSVDESDDNSDDNWLDDVYNK